MVRNGNCRVTSTWFLKNQMLWNLIHRDHTESRLEASVNFPNPEMAGTRNYYSHQREMWKPDFHFVPKYHRIWWFSNINIILSYFTQCTFIQCTQLQFTIRHFQAKATSLPHESGSTLISAGFFCEIVMASPQGFRQHSSTNMLR